jgi:hypothetical protein
MFLLFVHGEFILHLICGFVPGFVNYKKGCTRLAAASDKVYQLLAHGRWFSPGTLASSTTKTGHHDIAESGIKQQKSINQSSEFLRKIPFRKMDSIIM